MAMSELFPSFFSRRRDPAAPSPTPTPTAPAATPESARQRAVRRKRSVFDGEDELRTHNAQPSGM